MPGGREHLNKVLVLRLCAAQARLGAPLAKLVI